VVVIFAFKLNTLLFRIINQIQPKMLKKVVYLLSIAANFANANAQTDAKAYTQKIPGTNLSFDMQPIPAGKFLMGSPETEAGRKTDEGPQHEVTLNAFWMAKVETTWDIYSTFLNKDLEVADPKEDAEQKKRADAVARPTRPYVEMSFGMGKNGGFPVCNITNHAAVQFCKWLYEKTGVFYRLPTEAEWEHAARGGTQTAFHFGDDPAQLPDYGWFFENSDGAYKKVGQKKPNQYGLHDMHGNVAEWTMDAYEENFYTKPEAANNPTVWATKLYPQVIRGGSWDDDAVDLRSAKRRPSTPALKQRDPQIPRSDWWLTDAPILGFRVVRPAIVPSKEEIERYYQRPPKDI
jgi:formylglycine-generating enzyme